MIELLIAVLLFGIGDALQEFSKGAKKVIDYLAGREGDRIEREYKDNCE